MPTQTRTQFWYATTRLFIKEEESTRCAARQAFGLCICHHTAQSSIPLSSALQLSRIDFGRLNYWHIQSIQWETCEMFLIKLWLERCAKMYTATVATQPHCKRRVFGFLFCYASCLSILGICPILPPFCFRFAAGILGILPNLPPLFRLIVSNAVSLNVIFW